MDLTNDRMRWRDRICYLTRDPIGYADGPNLYCYVHCNPIASFDPLGLADINFHAYKGASEKDVAAAKQMLQVALDARNEDGSKPESVIRLEYILSDENEHDVDVWVGDHIQNISEAQNPVWAENGKGTKTEVAFDPHSEGTYQDGVKRDPTSILVHEVAGHGYNNAKGIATTQSDQEKEEKNATYIENTHRAAKGLSQRTKYYYGSGSWDVETVDTSASKTASSNPLPDVVTPPTTVEEVMGESTFVPPEDDS